MIHLFRRIRNKLIGQGKFSKYLLYALGEIALVVIGILIALQINLWNEGKKAISLEKSTLVELNHTLTAEIESFEKLIRDQLKLGQDSKLLLDHLIENKPYSSKLDTLWERGIRYYTIEFNNSAYELLESRGIDLIRNAELRNRIIQHYNNDQSKINRTVEIVQRNSDSFMDYAFDRLYPPISDDFATSFNYKNEVLIPSNYREILDDPVMIAKLSHSIKVRVRISQMLKEFIVKQSSLSAMINNELDHLDKK